MDTTKCKQIYSLHDTKTLLNYSEGVNPADLAKQSQEVETMYGKVNVSYASEEKTGHAQQRHLAVTTHGLKTRTKDADSGEKAKDGMVAQGIPVASGFLKDQMQDLIRVVRALLNSAKGQAGLEALDADKMLGKTRMVIIEHAATLACSDLDVRIFYQDSVDQSVKSEKLDRAALVVDSNLGGKYPIKIITAFPCKDGEGLSICRPELLIQAKQARDAFEKTTTNIPEAVFRDNFLKLVKKTRKNITDDVFLNDRYMIAGRIFNSGWFVPAPEYYGVGAIVPKMIQVELTKDLLREKGYGLYTDETNTWHIVQYKQYLG